MHSHNFQGTKFKLRRQVKDFVEQVVEGLTILRYPRGLGMKGQVIHERLGERAQMNRGRSGGGRGV